LSLDLQFVIIPIVSSSFWPLFYLSLNCKSRDKQYNGQKLEDTIGVITNCKSRDKQYNGQKLEDTIGIITNCKSKDRQYNGQKLEDKL
jgi:hypothetical protein